MKLKKIAIGIFGLFAILMSATVLMPTPASALTCDDGQTVIPEADARKGQSNSYCVSKGLTYTERAGVGATPFTANPAGEKDCSGGTCIQKDINLAINLLAGLVGIVVTSMLVIGGLQYGTSRDNPQAVQAAKAKITNAVIAIIAFIFVYAFLQYIVPGGLF